LLYTDPQLSMTWRCVSICGVWTIGRCIFCKNCIFFNEFTGLWELDEFLTQSINNMVAASMKKCQGFLWYRFLQSETPVTVPPIGKCTVVTHSTGWTFAVLLMWNLQVLPLKA